MSHLLLVDDDVEVLALLQKFLEQQGYSVEIATDGPSLWRAMERRLPDLIMLDVMLPGDSGLVLCRQLRAKYSIAVIMLTARDKMSDRIMGLEMGADDYLTKPFDLRELLARVRSVLRRVGAVATALSENSQLVLAFADWQLNVNRRELRSPGNVMIPLSTREFELLLVFVEHPQRILTRQQLVGIAHSEADDTFDRSIDVQVSRLRRKLEADVHSTPLIRTIRNRGYLFSPAVAKL